MIRHHTSSARAPILAVFVALLAVAASVPTAAMVGAAPPAAEGAGRSVVMLDGSGGTVCTATAVGRDLLLTAAHCVQPGSQYKFLDNPASREARLKDIARIERHPQFDLKKLFAHVATADVALVKLAEALPARIPTSPLGSESETVAVGDTFVVAGYGVTVRGAEKLDGVVRAATLVATGQLGTLQIRLFDPRTKGESAGLGACTGDSGAPAFREENGSLAIIGVVSWSTGPKLTAGCGGLTGVTPIVRYRSWIVETARALASPLASEQR
jgi:secreted trypsin-like serine protease